MSQKINACHGVGSFFEPLYLVGDRMGKTEFGRVPVCAKCRKPVGEVKLDRSAAARKFTATSWVVMMDRHAHAPYNFVLSSAGMLVPEFMPMENTAVPAPHTPEMISDDAEFR